MKNSGNPKSKTLFDIFLEAINPAQYNSLKRFDPENENSPNPPNGLKGTFSLKAEVDIRINTNPQGNNRMVEYRIWLWYQKNYPDKPY